MAALMTTAEVKVLLQIADSTYDALIAAFIPIVEKWIENRTGIDGTVDGWNAGLKLIAAKRIKFEMENKGMGLTSWRIGQVSQEMSMDALNKELDQYAIIRVI